MKKILFIVFLTMLLIFISGSIWGANYEVSGAGQSLVNGTYIENGTYNGKSSYKLDGSNWDFYLRFYANRWTILYSSSAPYYSTDVSGVCPPTTGWAVDTHGAAPAPLITAPYSGGNGTETAPFHISTISDLIELSTTMADWNSSKYFIQTDDIDASTTSTLNSDGNGGYYGLTPIGSSERQFIGSYDGNWHIIENLYINRDTGAQHGLFGGINESIIKNIGLSNCNITGNNIVGTLVGACYSSEISNCYSTGSVIASDSQIGGLIGYVYGNNNISKCYTTASVMGTPGVNHSNLGGFIGKTYDNITISDCYSRGDIQDSGNLYNVGSFIGRNTGSSEIINCYSTGSVCGVSPYFDGFAGDNDSDCTISNSFWNVETDGIDGNSSGDDNYGATGKTTSEMQTQATFTGWDFTATTGIWAIDGTNNDGYPYLEWQVFGDDSALPVTLSSFTAVYSEGNAQLQWATQSESNNLGWNIYRGYSSNPETAQQINYLLIPGAGTCSIPTSYTFEDENNLIVETTYLYWLESVSNAGETNLYNPITLTIEHEEEEHEMPELPKVSILYKNFPNPFNPKTEIKFYIEEGETGELTILNIRGQAVDKMKYEAGTHRIIWEGSEFGSGVYFYKLETPSYNKIEKMLMLK